MPPDYDGSFLSAFSVVIVVIYYVYHSIFFWCCIGMDSALQKNVSAVLWVVGDKDMTVKNNVHSFFISGGTLNKSGDSAESAD